MYHASETRHELSKSAPPARRSMSQPRPAPAVGLSRAERASSVPPVSGSTGSDFVSTVPNSYEPTEFTAAVIPYKLIFGKPQRRQKTMPVYKTADSCRVDLEPGQRYR